MTYAQGDEYSANAPCACVWKHGLPLTFDFAIVLLLNAQQSLLLTDANYVKMTQGPNLSTALSTESVVLEHCAFNVGVIA